MNKVNQRTATVNTLLAVLTDRDQNYELNGEIKINDVLTPQDREQARQILFTMFRSGSVIYKESFQVKVDDDVKLKSYISGLVNNWVRKAKEFNVGLAYEAKNKGSRAGASDPEVKNMKLLLSVTTDPKAKVEIQSAIDAKLAEIKASKQTEVIDMSQIPAELLAKLGLESEEEA